MYLSILTLHKRAYDKIQLKTGGSKSAKHPEAILNVETKTGPQKPWKI